MTKNKLTNSLHLMGSIFIFHTLTATSSTASKCKKTHTLLSNTIRRAFWHLGKMWPRNILTPHLWNLKKNCIVLYCKQYSNIFICANSSYQKGILEIGQKFNLWQKKLYHNFKGNLQFFQKETLRVLIHLKQNRYGNCKLLFSKVSISRVLKPTITFLWQYFVNIYVANTNGCFFGVT